MPQPLSETQWPDGWHIRRVGDGPSIFIVSYGRRHICAFQDEVAAECALCQWKAQMTDAQMAAGITPNWTVPLAQACLNAVFVAERVTIKKTLAEQAAEIETRHADTAGKVAEIETRHAETAGRVEQLTDKFAETDAQIERLEAQSPRKTGSVGGKKPKTTKRDWRPYANGVAAAMWHDNKKIKPADIKHKIKAVWEPSWPPIVSDRTLEDFGADFLEAHGVAGEK
jgi:hypothetical protein